MHEFIFYGHLIIYWKNKVLKLLNKKIETLCTYVYILFL